MYHLYKKLNDQDIYEIVKKDSNSSFLSKKLRELLTK